MLKLLLDEHVSPDVADGLRRRNKNIAVTYIADWEEGRFMGLADELFLEEAVAQKLTLVTYDRRTIPPLLKTWAEADHDHGGVIFVDEKTIAPPDIGGLIRGLQAVFKEFDKADWTNRVFFLRREKPL